MDKKAQDKLRIREHERQEYEEHRRRLAADIHPLGAAEHELFEQLLAASWRLRRIQRLENGVFQNEANPLLDPETTRKLDRLIRNRAAAERSYHHALEALKRLQGPRRPLKINKFVQ